MSDLDKKSTKELRALIREMRKEKMTPVGKMGKGKLMEEYFTIHKSSVNPGQKVETNEVKAPIKKAQKTEMIIEKPTVRVAHKPTIIQEKPVVKAPVKAPEPSSKKAPSAYNLFVSDAMKSGMTMKEASMAWGLQKKKE